MKIMPETTTVLLSEEHSGRDEMNLAGNPFALLQAASRAGQTFIMNEWERTLPNGKIVKAVWNVKGDSVLGLPGPTEELLYLVLLQLTRESAGEGATSAEWPQKVMFSRYDVLSRMGLGDRSRDYNELKNAFYRLQSVSIQAENSFHDPRTGSPHKAIGFSILNDFALNDEPRGRKSKTQSNIPLSWFEWNKVLFDSFLAGNVRSLALDFVLSLDLPTTRRLFRFLDMMRGSGPYYNREFIIGLFKLRDRLGMTGYKYASKIKEKLNPALEELVARDYLKGFEYQSGKSGELIVFRFGNAVEVLSAKIEQGGAEQDSNSTIPQQSPKTRQKPTQIALLEEEEPVDVRADALRCYELFQTLPESEQNELLEIARRDVSPIWHDRVGQPESPMSLGLWQLVTDRYPERLK
jgi:hypothetical protein